jgi:hypothetical protein
MHYGLKPYYDKSKHNNIICEIEKYGKTYKAEKEFVFGSAGVNGTKYSMSIELEKLYGVGDAPANKPTSTASVRYIDGEFGF